MKFLLMPCLLFSGNLLADQTLRWKEGPGQIQFKIGYTMGTHEGKADAIGSGEIVMDDARTKILKGRFTLPISVLTTGDAEKDCHMVEALGLDYEKSRFPEDHVCEENQLPRTGPDSVAFPEIKFEIEGPAELSKGVMNGKLTLHGRSQRVGNLPFKWITDRISAEFKVRLDSFGVIVKKFLFIGVAEEAQVKVNLLF